MQIITAEEFKKSYDKSYQVYFDNCVEKLLSDINKKLKELMKKNEESIDKPQEDLHILVNEIYKDDMVNKVTSILKNNGFKVNIQVYDDTERMFYISI